MSARGQVCPPRRSFALLIAGENHGKCKIHPSLFVRYEQN
jgi:hypothetical protein